MAKKLTEKALVKNLEIMSRVELVKIITELFKTNKVVEARLNLLFLGDEYGSELLEKYKKQLYKIFNPTNIVRTGFSLEKAKMVLSDFLDICGDSKWYGDLALYFAECATDFTMSYGDIDENVHMEELLVKEHGRIDYVEKGLVERMGSARKGYWRFSFDCFRGK